MGKCCISNYPQDSSERGSIKENSLLRDSVLMRSVSSSVLITDQSSWFFGPRCDIIGLNYEYGSHPPRKCERGKRHIESSFFVHIESSFVHIHSRVFIQISNCDIFLCTLTCRQSCILLLTSHIKSDGAEYSCNKRLQHIQSDWCS